MLGDLGDHHTMDYGTTGALPLVLDARSRGQGLLEAPERANIPRELPATRGFGYFVRALLPLPLLS